MAMNMASGVAVFVLNLCVSFFLTPFIVSRLGTAAYGFVGLSNNIIGYTLLLTVAVNSMASRFVTVKVHEGHIKQANVYLSSVFFANVILAIFIIAVLAILVLFLPDILNIPENLIGDVRLLFSLLALSTCFGLMTGVFYVSTFICNRLDFTNLRTLIGTLIRVVLLLFLFGFLPARLWYIGISVLAMEIYGIAANYWFFRTLTPELEIKRNHFNFNKLKEVTFAGAWNILNKLSEILSRGLDLLLANLFIGALAMGQLSISQTLPVLILSFVGTLTANFGPELTRLYAQKHFEQLKSELLQSVRISSIITCIPLTIVFVYSGIFYSLWLPEENTILLYKLTAYGCLGLIFALPLEPLWNIFIITNRVRQSSLNLIYFSVAQFIVVISLMVCTDNTLSRLFLLVVSRVVFTSVRCLTFLPIYGARCLGYKPTLFYPLILKNLLCTSLTVGISFVYRILTHPQSWIGLFLGALFSAGTCIFVFYVTMLNKNDRTLVVAIIKRKLKLNIFQ